MPNPFIPFDNTCQLNALYLLEDEPVENVYHFSGTAPWTATSMLGLAVQFAGWESTEAAHHRSSDVLYVGSIVRDLSTQFGAEVSHTDAVPGILTGPRLPNHCTIAIKAATGLVGRSNRGRSFWIGLTQDQLDPSNINLITSAVASALVAHMNAMVGLVWTNGGKPVVASRRTGGHPRVVGVTTPILNYGLSNLQIDSQRRRLPGHNRHG